MTIVVDSNIIAAVFLDTPYSNMAQFRYVSWLQAGIPLLAPILFEYEIATIIRRYIKAGMITNNESQALLDDILSCNIQIVAPSRQLHYAALRWADKTGQSKTYDAHYLALAEQKNAEFWSADKRLVNSAHQLGLGWVHWIDEP